MPELPEVETVRLGLNQVTLNQPIRGGDVLLDRTVAYPTSSIDFLTGLDGTAIAQWHRYGKYLLAELSDGWLGVHLRMTGQLLWLDQTEPLHKHTRVRLFFGDDRELRFVDQRTFGQMWWVPRDRDPKTIITGLQKLGPEPFSADFSDDYFVQQLKNRRRPIKTALLDQMLVAGVGNIYADEALFLSGIRPETLCAELSPAKIKRLRSSVVRVLQDSINARGTTFSDFRDVSGVNGNYGNIAWVYARDGEACRTCETIIQRLKLAGRSSHFCPNCQR
ncbi:DNA-formamidopyrimidine glycosylase [Phormidesmis priestleyi ULC007]|uniref:Formamidopyrimidine-DNA glycosylase n=1 Tax=Phormidesmis priestleyi ULC007 TaxID=1920490 RepID=A0A2T1DFQ3_9CYAN|nr:DNA-formamidopyrimidine glycosylase [Phormidesmis priestleyi]PSB19293.1 DNA-formamidopyrimidine glycosylase [Phormidesmis priestleyi ULC007]PZO52178.1 MAG: DNA-formamidopyrimidine glycosylase [Phormidesmis priestleyi]